MTHVIDNDLVKMAIRGIEETWDAIAMDIMQASPSGLSTNYHAREVVEISADHMEMYADPDNKAAFDLVDEECRENDLHTVSYLAAEMPHGLYGY